MFTRAIRTQVLRPITRSFHSSIPLRVQAHEAGFVFDMDGVLVKGKKAIPGAREALQLLQDRNIAWILMTNGGGVSEKQRAEFLSEELDLDIDISQIVQSHTPLVTLANKENQRVLVVGGDGDKSRKVAEEYGFGEVVIPADYVKTIPSIWPFNDKELLSSGKIIPGIDEKKIDTIMIFNDPRDLGTDLQVIFDILEQDPSTPVIFSNNDWVWANEYSKPRFGQGLPRFIIEQVYQEIYAKELNRTILGKPTKVAYDYAHHILINRSIELNKITHLKPSNLALGQEITESHVKQVFMVGDNPASDIIGGFNYGWNTALVKTGVYKDGDKLPVTPTIIAKDVYEAVHGGIKHLGLL
ncbi:hypothetical protein BN7_2608 [Wickerhamomyces ciferrii]|uniref:HAD-superfamily hydrolase n=1 Tax=Wickerhamomyces ciferrii (strain ATCC 14091 / BCRC 22168 / CBS 111 / JCM 3599 / NBRC 0793 / NRRL Y-1031 F-60-10) TaxID=1206466 RepID=K0KJA9_WICCF|nr:uncharacterized protein BN7_2608 [Wickerhamomyces ciferrii]CCH43061.1 hypothetical protein BN7_2608 [Wickerhamomyces ciferrii]